MKKQMLDGLSKIVLTILFSLTLISSVSAIEPVEPSKQYKKLQAEAEKKAEKKLKEDAAQKTPENSSQTPVTESAAANNVSADAKKLAAILADTLTYQADFEQSVYRENSDIAEVTLGRFLIQRPNHFKWQTNEPFEQVIIADGDHLWTFDQELEQVTIQNQQSVLADSPLLLLTSSVDSLVEAFDIQQIKSKENNNQHLYALSPKKNSLFESVHILIENKKIKEFFLVDTLGGRTSVKFDHIQLNQSIEVKEFIFVPPEGIDIIDSREAILD